MKFSVNTRFLVAALTCCIVSTSFADFGLSSINTSITNNADQKMINAINLTLPFVVSDWNMLATYYNQNSSFPPAGAYAVDTSILSGVNSITNTSSGTLEIHFGPNAPGPMANNGYALAPTRVTRNGNTFYVYELVQCYTNIIDSTTALNTPQPGMPSNLFSNSNLGSNCVYAADPYSAAVSQVQGNGMAPSTQNGVSP